MFRLVDCYRLLLLKRLYVFSCSLFIVLFTKLVFLCFSGSFLTQSILTFGALLNFDLNFSCNWLSLKSKSFSSFCLALLFSETYCWCSNFHFDHFPKSAFVIQVAIFVDELWYLFCYHLPVTLIRVQWNIKFPESSAMLCFITF